MQSEARTREQLLELIASYFGRDQVRSVVEELAGASSGKFQAPATILTILFASRAGSNYLGQLLSGTGWFNEIGESFRPSQLAKTRDRHGLAGLHEAAQWMIDNRGTERAFGFKAGFHVLTAAVELDFLPQVIERTHFVLLRRHDRVAQAIALVKGRLSGQMHSGQPQGRPLNDDDYDADAIHAQVLRIKRRESEYEELVERLGKVAPVVYYEDVVAQPAEQVARICRHAGLEMPAPFRPEVRLKPLRDDLSRRWAERFRAENPGCR